MWHLVLFPDLSQSSSYAQCFSNSSYHALACGGPATSQASTLDRNSPTKVPGPRLPSPYPLSLPLPRKGLPPNPLPPGESMWNQLPIHKAAVCSVGHVNIL